MSHGEVRHHGLKEEPDGSAQTITETWCNHCRKWIPTNGVLGPLTFMAKHRDGDCQQS